MKKSNKVYRNVLRILGSIAVIGYILFLIGEKVPLFNEASIEDVSVYILFAAFLLGYIFLWKNELISGILLVAWYGFQWCLVLWVWKEGEVTLMLGFPIAVIGILVLIYGIRQKVTSSPDL